MSILGELKQFFVQNHKVLLLGATVGLVTALVLGELGSDLTFAAQPSIFDAVVGTQMSLITLAKTKVALALMSLGASIAYLTKQVVG